MKKLMGLGVVVCALGAPALAQAQNVTPIAWRDDGNLVIEVRDPMEQGGGFDWVGDKGSDNFYAVCTPGAIDSWNSGCQVCLTDAGQADPAVCGLDKLKKWPKKGIKAGKKSPNKKVAVTDKRKCADGADGKECQNTIAIGKLGTVSYNNSNAALKPVISAWFRKDSNAVLIIADEQSASDESMHFHSFVLIDLTALSGTAGDGSAAKGGGSAFLKKWKQITDKLCACKSMDCVNGLTQELTDLANQAGTEAANMTPAEMQELQDSVMKMSDCMSKIAGSQSP